MSNAGKQKFIDKEAIRLQNLGQDPFEAQANAEMAWQEKSQEAAAESRSAAKKAAKEKAIKDYEVSLAKQKASQAREKIKYERARNEWLKKNPTQPTSNFQGTRPSTEQDYKDYVRKEKFRQQAQAAARFQEQEAARRRAEEEVRLANEQLAAEEARLEEIRRQQMMERYSQNIQSFLYREMNNIKQHIKTLNPKEAKKDYKIDENIHRLYETCPAGSFNSLITGRGGTEKGLGAFVRATPAQLALLQPLMRFYIVDQEGNDREIYFSDYTTEKYAKQIANLRSSGTMKEILAPRSQRGSDAGIKSFTWNYNNKHEGDFIIDAQVELYFGTLAELANVNYLQFLFPTGAATELAGDLVKTSEKIADAEQKRPTTSFYEKTKSEKVRKLTSEIRNLSSIMGAEDLSDAAKVQGFEALTKKTVGASEKKAFRQLKVVVGWSEPKGNKAELLKLFDSETQYRSFIEGVEATQKAIFLNLADYNVDFTQEGPATLSLRYIGSTDNYLATAGSDVFGSANLETSTNEYMFTPTAVSLVGIENRNGTLVDKKKGAQNKNSSVNVKQASYIISDFKEIDSPYLKSKRKTLAKNTFEEDTIEVSLGGLKKAQDLLSMKLKREQLLNSDEDSAEIEKIRQSGQFITLLYDRAVNIRLRDIYARFLKDLLKEEDMLYAVRITAPASTGKPPSIAYVNPAADFEKLWNNIELTASGAQGPVQQVGGNPNDTLIYFMRFGDILRRAMHLSGCREDISLILGNVERFGVSHSIYDIPITLDTFGQFFYNTVVSRRRKFFPFRYFLNGMLKTVATMINQDDTILSKVAFDFSLLSTRQTDAIREAPFTLEASNLADIRSGQDNPLMRTGKYQHVYPIYETKLTLGARTGDRNIDEKEGIYHYVIGSDRGLAKTFNFSRQEAQYFQEMLIESNTLDDKIQALFLPQNVSIKMYGNTLHKNGDLIYVDSRPSLGSFAGPVLGIGGYYRVIRSSHSISNRGYETDLECVFELRVTPDKTRGPA